jgi:hypothetical protein
VFQNSKLPVLRRLLITPVFLSDQFGPYPLMKAELVPGSLQDV